MDVVNNPVSSTDIRLTSSMVSTPIVKDNCTEDPSTSGTNMVNNLVSSMPIAPTSSIDTRKQLQFEDEHIDLPEGIILVEDMLDMTQSEVLSSDDEFSMVCVEETPPSNWQFSPITNASRQQLGPLVQISHSFIDILIMLQEINVFKEKYHQQQGIYMVMEIVTSEQYHTFFLVWKISTWKLEELCVIS